MAPKHVDELLDRDARRLRHRSKHGMSDRAEGSVVAATARAAATARTTAAARATARATAVAAATATHDAAAQAHLPTHKVLEGDGMTSEGAHADASVPVGEHAASLW